MNNRGQVAIFTLMLFIVIVILALAFSPVIKQITEEARSPTSDTALGLDCSNTSISDFQNAGCVSVDLLNPYFFWGLLGIAGIIIGAKIIT